MVSLVLGRLLRNFALVTIYCMHAFGGCTMAWVVFRLEETVILAWQIEGKREREGETTATSTTNIKKRPVETAQCRQWGSNLSSIWPVV